MTGRHEGGTAPSPPAYAYTGRHEAPAIVPGCLEHAYVASGDGEASGILMCNRAKHDDPQHYDAADGIMWTREEQAPTGYRQELAGAVA